MDVAIVTTRIVDRDAQGNFTAATLEALRDAGKGRVALYTFACERPTVSGIEVRYLGGVNRHGIGTNLKALLRTFTTAKELATFDRLVLAGPDVGALPAVHLAKRHNPGLKLVWVYHGLTPPEQLTGKMDRLLTRVRRAAYVRSMKHSDLVKTDSHYSKKELAGRGVDPSKITVIPIGIEISRFSPGTAAPAGGIFRLLYVGRLASGKRVDNLIRAMAMMKDRPVDLTIVGGGPEWERLEALADELGVKARVKFAGRVPDEELPGYYRGCDAWVTASEHEGFCVPVVEAMACGKPVIVPDITAMPETGDGAALIYRSGDVGALVRSVTSLCDKSGPYESLSARAIQKASSYDINSVMERYISLILDADGKP